MKSRMEKYYENDIPMSRTSKNQELYKEMNHSDIEGFNVNSNVSVLGDNSNVIDVDKLRDMLDRKYREEPKRKSIKVDIPNEIPSINLDETKEYDINSILEKARENKTASYEEERFKKLRDTQYDILKNLDLPNKKEPTAKEKEEEKLMDLIHTITIKENEMKEDASDPLDLFTDLKGSGHTEVIHGLREEIEKTINVPKETKEEIEQAVKQEVKKEIDNSFYTNSMSFTQSDFDDFNDLKEEVKSHKTVIAVLIVFIVIAFIFALFLLLNNFLGWGII